MNYYDVFIRFIENWFPTGTLPADFISWLIGFMAISVMYAVTALLFSVFTVRRRVLMYIYLMIMAVYSMQYVIPMIPVAIHQIGG